MIKVFTWLMKRPIHEQLHWHAILEACHNSGKWNRHSLRQSKVALAQKKFHPWRPKKGTTYPAKCLRTTSSINPSPLTSLTFIKRHRLISTLQSNDEAYILCWKEGSVRNPSVWPPIMQVSTYAHLYTWWTEWGRELPEEPVCKRCAQRTRHVKHKWHCPQCKHKPMKRGKLPCKSKCTYLSTQDSAYRLFHTLATYNKI